MSVFVLQSCLWVWLLANWPVSAYPIYRTKIPNGFHVPNPCNASEIWAGVGHQNPLGGGDRNSFGLAFADNGHTWTQALCNADSDGDGRTNGQELGDAGCQWTETGTFQPASIGLSHPGVCEPLDSPRCLLSNSWLQCGINNSCPAVAEPGVLTVDIRMPAINVSTADTTYMCLFVALPSDRKYHVIADAPIIDNTNVVHHIIIYGCKANVDLTDNLPREPWVCSMAPACQQFIAVYSFGQRRDCFPDNYGFPIGDANSARNVIMQIHYSNMEHLANQVDSSGMKLYYTPNLRQFDADIITVGQLYLTIPPNEPIFVETGYCRQECSSVLPSTDPINITDIYLHMHLLGTWMNVTHYRGGVPMKVLVSEGFKFTSPQRVYLQQEEVFYPGDELRVDCVFNSTGRTNFTYFGEKTNDEMCLAFATYYPANKNLETCTQWKSYPVCTGYFVATGCNASVLNDILQSTSTSQCNYSLGCQEPCVERLVNKVAATGCLERDLPELIVFVFQRYETLQDLFQLITYCHSLSSRPTSSPTPGPTPLPTGSSHCKCSGEVKKCLRKCCGRERCIKNCIRGL